MASKKQVTISGFPISFERRRYGRQTYTWVYFQKDGDWIGLGDPWPAVTPKRSEIETAIKQALAREVEQEDGELLPEREYPTFEDAGIKRGE